MKKSKPPKSVSENGSSKKNDDKDFLIVGIGASAGGIQALKEFFENVPADSGVAYVVILHLSPDHESRLAEVLQTTARIPVTQVERRVKVEPNHVYVVPPNKHLEILDGHIGVEPNVNVEERRAPIDIFFRNLAESHQARAISVVLSGTGADGSMGLKRVKERGGACFVQNPREAEFSEMPRNSIATDLVDQVLNVAEIPAKIIAYKTNLTQVKIQDSPESRPENDQTALREIFALLRVRTGHDFTNYKHPTVLRRIARRVSVRELLTLAEYAACLRENPDETVALLKDLLISVTNFFRDKEAFRFLETEVVPRVLRDKTSDDEIRVWVAGCATGEEAYGLAMLFAEQFEANTKAPAVLIFATDIDETAIAHAREGFYSLVDAADVSPDRLNRFFIKDGGGFRVRHELREMVLFTKHNLLKDPPFSRLDLVTCRNLLIYFNDAAQKRTMETFHFALNPGAFLFLGTSESIDGAGDLFASVSKEHRIYQSREAAAQIQYPVPEVWQPMRYAEQKMDAMTVRERENRLLERISFSELHQQLLEQYAAPSIVVNENYDIVHLSPRAGRFLQFAGGEPTKNLLRLIRSELRLELRTALFQAVQRRANVAANVKTRIDGQAETIRIQVRPVLRADDTARGFLLVLFDSCEAEDDENAAEKIVSSNSPVVLQLEEELEKTKTELRYSVEQYEAQTEELRASNEELQAINEELRTTAEELETSREELQSVNEELLTVNEELQLKIEELSQSNSDFQNLLTSSDIGTIFLDRRLRVKMFTPLAREVFNLIDTDLNRPLADISTRMNFVDLEKDAEQVLETLQTVERELQNGHGKWLLMRIYPYRTATNQIIGTVVTFIDITKRIGSEQALRNLAQSRDRQAKIFDTALSSIADFAYTFDSQGRFTYANKPLLDLLGITIENITGKTFHELPYPKELANKLHAQILQVVETGKIVRDDTPFTNPAGDEGFYEYIFTPVNGEDGTVEVVAGSTRVITERRQAEESIRFQAKLLNTVEQSVIATDLDGKVIFWNQFAEKLYGWTTEEALGRRVRDLTTPDIMIEQADEIMSKLRRGESWSGEFQVKRRDGTMFPAQVFNSPINDGQGNLIGIVGVSVDITGRKQTEEKLRESAEFNSTVLSSLTAQIAVLDSDGNISIVNEAWRKFARENGGENALERSGVGVNYLEVCRRAADDDFAVQTLAGIEGVLRGKLRAFSLEYPCLAGDEQRWFLLNVTPLQSGRGGAVVSHLDITERRQAEQSLSKSEERLRLLLESASDYAIFTVTKENTVDSWNTGAERTFGWKEKEIVGQSGAILFTPEDRARNVPAMEIECAAATGKAEDERWHIRKDGSRFYASGVMQPLRNGGIHGFVKICRDQTEKIEAEKALQDKEILQRLISAQEDERKRIARDLHDELGQQLTALRLKLEATRKICEEDEICGRIDEMQLIARQIDADVDFLAWELRPASLDELGLIVSIENYVREWSRHAGITAEFHASKLKKLRLAPEVETNLYRIAQEALNNTHKHAKAKSVSVMLEKRDDLIVLVIEDDGEGFNAKLKKNRGKGLGLVGMRERASIVGGTFEIESAPKHGTTVYVRVPATFVKKEKENA